MRKYFISISVAFGFLSTISNAQIIRLENVDIISDSGRKVIAADITGPYLRPSVSKLVLVKDKANQDLVSDCSKYLNLASSSSDDLQVVISTTYKQMRHNRVIVRYSDISSCAFRYKGSLGQVRMGGKGKGVDVGPVRMIRTFKKGSFAVQGGDVKVDLDNRGSRDLSNWQVVLQPKLRSANCHQKAFHALKSGSSFKVRASVTKSDLVQNIKTIRLSSPTVQGCSEGR
ncbi:hypothetical protein N9D31_02235 [Oligoflexaceae bacterium]|nr:hypothetical protein [Oligoflexaceae bacterium]